MPCWYYEKKDLRVTPSLKDGINADIEARYRREGARFIIDSGTKMGLRYDTCATGVVYFHRFYMFHSFREFHRYVTASCCLFLAGKVEETPKKCKDIIKVTRNMLTEAQFGVFGEDPREEVMTMERILLQTIKFDLMVEHPYAYLMKFAKLIKGDKDKTQKLVQMAWTFVNDSLCTSLCLQWEPDIIALSLMYLASRLTKVDITDWVGKVAGQKMKWFEGIIEDSTLEILEEVCHQVLDLYSTTPQASKEESPPPPPPPPPPKPSISPVPIKTPTKRSRSPSPSKPSKTSRHASPVQQQHRSQSPTYQDPGPLPQKPLAAAAVATAAPVVAMGKQPKTSYEQTNPFMSSTMYSSSFLSGEGSNAIQTLIGTRQQPAQAQVPLSSAAAAAYVPVSQYSASQPPPQNSRVPATYAANPAYPSPAGNYQYQQQPPPSRPTGSASTAAAAAAYPQGAQYSSSASQQPVKQQQQYGQYAAYSQQANYQQYPQQQQQQPGVTAATAQAPTASAASASQQGQVYGNYSQPPPGYTSQAYGGQYRGATGRERGGQQQARPRLAQSGSTSSSLTPVRITGRQQQQHRR